MELKLRDLKTAFPNFEEEPWWHRPTYKELIKSMGVDIVVQIDEGDYQGDTLLCVTTNNQFGILYFGWGSCSGCDWLQDCNTYTELEELRTALANKIHWHDTIADAVKFTQERDWKALDAYFIKQKFIDTFIEKLKAFIDITAITYHPTGTGYTQPPTMEFEQ